MSTATLATERTSRLTLSFVLLGGAVAWTAHLLLAYAIAEFGCVAGLGKPPGPMGITIVSWMLLAMSAVMVALAAWALAISYRIRREAAPAAPAAPEAPDADERATAVYVGRFGLITNGLFLFIILIQSVPIFFYLGAC